MWRGHTIFFSSGYRIIVFFVVAVLICALNTKQLECQMALFGGEGGEAIMRFNCLQIPELMWHNRNYHVKFQLHPCTLSLHVCTVYVCMHIFCTLNVTLSRHKKGRSHMGCPALFNFFTTTSMDSGRESILIKHCLSKSGRTAELQKLRTQVKMHLTHWNHDVKSTIRNLEKANP